MFPRRTRHARLPRLVPNQLLDIAVVDQLLDVPTPEHDARLQRVAREFCAKAIRLEVTGVGVDAGAAGERATMDESGTPFSQVGVDSRVTWVGLYEAQIQRIPRLDRHGEFLMARRYEFLKVRARIAMTQAGFEAEQIRAIEAEGYRLPDEVPENVDRIALRYAARCLQEVQHLRRVYVESALYMVTACAHRYRGLGVDLQDLVQEGNASLFQAIDGFDWRRDVRFKTYAQYWIHQAILKLLYNASRTVRIPVWVQKTLKKVQRIREEARRADGREIANEEVARKLGMPVERLEELLATRRYAVSIDAELPGDEDGGSLSQTLADERDVPVPELVQDGNLQERLGELLKELPERESQILSRRFGLDGSTPETLGEIAADLGITAERVRQLQKAALARLQRPARIQRLKAFA